VEPKKK
jgi:hypothetical protein